MMAAAAVPRRERGAKKREHKMRASPFSCGGLVRQTRLREQQQQQQQQ
jgi:hypothetical protein